MPVHGEWRHLRAHAALAEETGMPADRVVLAEDGVVVDLVDGQASIVGSVPIGNVYVDGLDVGDVGEESLQARRILGDEGFIALTVVIDSVDRHDRAATCTCPPAASPTTRPRSTRRCRWSRTNLERALQDDEVDPHRLAQVIRRTVGRWVSRHLPPPPDDHPDRPRGLSGVAAVTVPSPSDSRVRRRSIGVMPSSAGRSKPHTWA